MNDFLKRHKDLLISICVFLSGFSCFAQLYYFQPLLPDLSECFTLSASVSSLTVSFSTLGMVGGLVVAMFAADRFPRKVLICTALLVSAIACIAASFATTFFTVVALSGIKGFVLSGATSVSVAYITEEVSPRNRNKIVGLYIAGNAIGGMGGRVISSFMAGSYDWRVASVTIGLICAAFAIAFLCLAPRSVNFTPHKSRFHSLVLSNIALFTSGTLVPFYLCGSLMLGIFVSLYNYLGFYLVEPPFNFDPDIIHYIYLMYIFGVFGSVATAKLEEKFRCTSVLKTVIIISVAALLIMYIPIPIVVTLGLAVFTFNFFVVHVTCNRIVSEMSFSHKSIALSIYLLLYYLGSSFWGWATGLVLDHVGWQGFIASLIILTVILYLIARHGSARLRRYSMKRQ